MNQEPKKKRATIPAVTEVDVAPPGYQPSKPEQEEEVTMPNLSIENAHNLSTRPSRMVRADPRKRRRTHGPQRDSSPSSSPSRDRTFERHSVRSARLHGTRFWRVGAVPEVQRRTGSQGAEGHCSCAPRSDDCTSQRPSWAAAPCSSGM